MPLPNKNRLKPPFASMPSAKRNVRETEIAVSIETKTPSPKTSAKPWMIEVPNQKRMTAVIIEEILESRIEGHARPKPSLIASDEFLPERNSSLMRSKIRMLASTAIPIERMNPAMPAAVSVTGRSMKIASITAT